MKPDRPKLNTTEYNAAVKCTSGASVGAVRLRDMILKAWSGSRDMGIFNCRSVRGGSSLSLHGEGRAIDIGGSPSVMQGIAKWAKTYSGWYGIQEVIYNRKIWTASRANEGWRTYSGTNPHTDHVHIGLTKTAATNASFIPEKIYGKSSLKIFVVVVIALIVAVALYRYVRSRKGQR